MSALSYQPLYSENTAQKFVSLSLSHITSVVLEAASRQVISLEKMSEPDTTSIKTEGDECTGDTKSIKSEGECTGDSNSSSPSSTRSEDFDTKLANLFATAKGQAFARRVGVEEENRVHFLPKASRGEDDLRTAAGRANARSLDLPEAFGVRGRARLRDPPEARRVSGRDREHEARRVSDSQRGRWLRREIRKMVQDKKINMESEPTMEEILKQIRLPSDAQLQDFRDPIKQWMRVHLGLDEQDPIPWLTWKKENLPEPEEEEEIKIKRDPDWIPPTPPRGVNLMGLADFRIAFNTSEKIPNNDVKIFSSVEQALKSKEEDVCLYQRRSRNIIRTTRKSLLEEEEKKKKLVEEREKKKKEMEERRRDRKYGGDQSGSKGKRKDPRDESRHRSCTAQRVRRRDSYASSRSPPRKRLKQSEEWVERTYSSSRRSVKSPPRHRSPRERIRTRSPREMIRSRSPRERIRTRSPRERIRCRSRSPRERIRSRSPREIIRRTRSPMRQHERLIVDYHCGRYEERRDYHSRGRERDRYEERRHSRDKSEERRYVRARERSWYQHR